MRTGIRISLAVLVSSLMACLSFSSFAMPICEEIYFSPSDINHEHPLKKPVPEFAKSYSLAQAGNAMEQRNVAVSYDAGYLVAACPEKARHWYREAARNGDQVAQKWVEEDDRFSEMLAGPEFGVVNHDAKPEKLASVAPGTRTAAGTKTVAAHPAGARAAGQMLADVADITRPPDSSSDMGKLIQIGRLVGGLVSHR